MIFQIIQLVLIIHPTTILNKIPRGYTRAMIAKILPKRQQKHCETARYRAAAQPAVEPAQLGPAGVDLDEVAVERELAVAARGEPDHAAASNSPSGQAPPHSLHSYVTAPSPHVPDRYWPAGHAELSASSTPYLLSSIWLVVIPWIEE